MWQSYTEAEVRRLEVLEHRWAETIQQGVQLLDFLSRDASKFLDETSTRAVLKHVYEVFPQLGAYPALGRTDGKMITYPPYDYSPEYDPRKRPWYQAAVERPGEVVFVPAFIHGILNEKTVALARTVYHDGKLIGVLGLDLVATIIGDRILEEGSYIVDSRGQVVASKGYVRGVFRSEMLPPDTDIFVSSSGMVHVLAKRSIGGTFIVMEHSWLQHATTPLLVALMIFSAVFSLIALLNYSVRVTLEKKLSEPLKMITRLAKNFLMKQEFITEPEDVDLSIEEIKFLLDELSDMISIVNAQFEEIEDNYKEIEQTNKELEEANELLKIKQEEIKETYKFLTERLAMIVEAFDEPTGLHISRVRVLSRFLAEKLGLPPELVEQIELYSPLHDLGKLMLPKDILVKPGPLTKEEFELVKFHPQWGANLLMGKDELKVAYNIALCHHERYDGSGYPRGLKGEEIPIEAQIVSLVDVYDALRSERPYKHAMSHEEAVSILVNGDHKTKPSHFSPKLMQVFLANETEIKNIWEALSAPISNV